MDERRREPLGDGASPPSAAYSLSLRFGLPGSGGFYQRARYARSGRRPCSVLWQWIGLRGLEARGVSRGNADGCRWSDAYSLSLRFGLPGSGGFYQGRLCLSFCYFVPVLLLLLLLLLSFCYFPDPRH
jgi:hypothetical protein